MLSEHVSFAAGVLREEEAESAAVPRRGWLQQEGAQALQRRLRRQQSRLHHQAGREVPRPVRDQLADREGLLWTGEMLMLSLY